MLVNCTDVQLDLKTTYLHNKDPFLWKPSLFVEQERLGEGGKTREKSKANEQREAETRLKFPNVSGGFPIFGSNPFLRLTAFLLLRQLQIPKTVKR